MALGSRLVALLFSLVAPRWFGFGLCGGSHLGTYLLMGWWGPGALAVCRAHQWFRLKDLSIDEMVGA